MHFRPNSRFFLPLSGLLLAVLLFGFASAGNSVLNLNDRDLDGYQGELVGGNDCVDSIQSVYMTNGTTCNPAGWPVFLESKFDPDTDDDIADHAWIKDDAGLYHLYFQNEDQGSGDYIEHYTSADLKSLTYVGPALQQTAGAWDTFGLWAPYVLKNPADGLYYLFYAGVTAPGSNPAAKQRIGVATSSDLTTWTKVAMNACSGTSGNGCVYECREPWTKWGNGGSYEDQCRDPMVIRDEANSRWLMLTTVLSNVDGPWSQMVSVAQSTDLLTWTGAGYIRATKRLWSPEGVGAQLTGGIAENPFVTEYLGQYYLFFTDSNDPEDYWNVPNPRTEIQYVSSASLDVDPAGSGNWTYRGSTRDPGVNAAEIQVVNGDTWIVSHSIVANPYSGFWGSHVRDLRLKRIRWNDDGSFTTSNLTNLDCRVPSAAINPGVAEACSDNLDNDCNAQVDDPLLCGVCVDGDADGYGASGYTQCAHVQPDCNDENSNVHPGATEYCEDGLDNNCSGEVDEAGCTLICFDNDDDGYGAAGFSACPNPGLDCNDNDLSVNPGAAEMCSDAVDNNCNTLTDEPLCSGICIDNDSDGYGTSGLLSCPNLQPDCNDANATIRPGALERCDQIDNNCDAQIDEGNICRRPRVIKWTLCLDDPVGPEGGGGACYVYY